MRWATPLQCCFFRGGHRLVQPLVPSSGGWGSRGRSWMRHSAQSAPAWAPAWKAKVEELSMRGMTLNSFLDFYQEDLSSMSGWRYVPQMHKTRDVVRRAIIPLTRAEETAYSVSTLNRAGARRAEVMVTHNWGNNFNDLLAAVISDNLQECSFRMAGQLLREDSHLLREILTKTGRLNVSYWICAFAVNQHMSICHSNPYDRDPLTNELHPVCRCSCVNLVDSDGRSTDSEINKFDDMMYHLASTGSCRQVIAVDQSFDLFQRAWCVAEIAEAKRLHMRQSLKLLSKAAIEQRAQSLGRLDIRNMGASSEKDKELILGKIGSIDHFNAELQSLIFDPKSGLFASWSAMDSVQQMSEVGRLIRWGMADGNAIQLPCPQVARAQAAYGFLGKAQRQELVEKALQESNVKDYRSALEDVYLERDRARARLKSRGEKDPGPIFMTPGCQKTLRRLEAEGHNLLTRARRQSKEKLTWVIGLASLGPGDGTAASEVPPGAARYWDTMEWSKEFTRSARPWDLASPILDPLLETLEDARICGADTSLRRRAEALLFMTVIRGIEAALASSVDRGLIVRQALDIADAALHVAELEDPGEVMKRYWKAEEEVFRSKLRSIEKSCPDFHTAVRDGDVDLVTWLLDTEQANPLEIDPEKGIPPLVQAAKAGDLAMCELLLDQGADIDARCSTDGTSSLHWACHSRTFRVVKLLLARRANPRLQDKRGHDALVKLVRRDVSTPAETCALSWHLQRSHRLAGPEETAGKMSIEDAKICAENLPETVGFSAHGVLEEVTLGSFYISFHGPGRAFVEDIPPPVKKKKKKKGEAVAPKAVPAEAVEAAVEVPAEEVPETAPVEAAPEAPVEAGAAEEAVQDAFPEEIPEVLEGEAEVDQTVEEVESEEESDDEPEELIWSHADPEWTSFLKVKNNAAHDVIALLSAAADPCAEDLDGLTALHHHLLSSPSRGSLDCVQALLRGGADVNHRDTHRSTTPFLLAVQSKRTDLVKAMLAHAWPPVDVDSQAPDGVCALALAQSLGAREIADLLRKAGASDWAGAELHLGSRTIFTYDTRKPPVNN
ncbi:unnamed protein product [Durusdinium trenchii]|uniref:Uncharacterized protein n=1 Tax=Durusdinium trenchii TaxID=1381693 RepID=A0ABP0H8Y1_9DINO